MKTQYIYGIRHAQTDANARDLIQGNKLDGDLNSLGVKQAELLGKYLKMFNNIYPSPDVIYTSSMLRAVRTAVIVHYELFGNTKLPEVISVPDLAEANHGKLDGLTWEEANKWHPEIIKNWRENPLKTKFPGGETARQAQRRMVNAWDKIFKENAARHVMLIAHGGTWWLLFSHILNIRNGRIFKQDNACLNVFTQNEKEGLRIKLINGTSHLTFPFPEALR